MRVFNVLVLVWADKIILWYRHNQYYCRSFMKFNILTFLRLTYVLTKELFALSTSKELGTAILMYGVLHFINTRLIISQTGIIH